jgi:hypothetical protein
MMHDFLHVSMPDFSLILLFVATAPLTAICIHLVFHPQYEDGFFGRLGLSGIGITAFARAVSVFSDAHPITPIGMVLWVSLSIFLLRHWWRFTHRRALWESRTHPAHPERTSGKIQSHP